MTTRELIDSTAGRFFTVEFVKRTTGEVRTMNCRLGVRKHLKGGPKAWDDKQKNLVTVFDLVKKSYRCVPLKSIEWLKVDGQKYLSNPFDHTLRLEVPFEVRQSNDGSPGQQVLTCGDPEDRGGEDRSADADVLAADLQLEIPG